MAATLVATGIYLTWLLVAHWREIDRALLRFRAAQTRWLLAAVGLELVSQLCLVLAQHRLLRRAGSRFGVFATARLVLAQNAISMAVPGGQAVASVFSYRQIRRRGAETTAAAWVVAATNVTTMAALATFGAFTATGFSWLTILSGTALLTALAVLVTLARRPERLARPAVALVRLIDHLPLRHPRAESPQTRVQHRFDRLRAVHMRWNDWAFIGGAACSAVAADFAVWYCASRAMIVLPARCAATGLTGRVLQQCAAFHTPTTAGLLVAYSAGQAALQLPLPGGVGAVEALMTASLTTVKVRAIQALSAVLLYRFISFWGVATIGAVMWLTMRRRRQAP